MYTYTLRILNATATLTAAASTAMSTFRQLQPTTKQHATPPASLFGFTSHMRVALQKLLPPPPCQRSLRNQPQQLRNVLLYGWQYRIN